MNTILQPWQLFCLILAGWINRRQQEMLEFYRAELEAMMKVQGKKRILLTDDQRRLLAVKGKSLGRKAPPPWLRQVVALAYSITRP